MSARPSRFRALAAALLALAVGIGVSAAVLELGVRSLIGTQVKFPRRVVGAPWGIRINEPGAVYRHESPDVSVQFRINAQGMRADRDYAYEKPDGVRRIVSLGDSFAAGYEVEGHEAFSSVLERELDRPDRRVEVLNAGVSGYSTAEAYLYLERELWQYDPDLVVLSFYVNDLVDNVRTNLFAVQDDVLVPRNPSYVPGGALGNFLNTNTLFNLLSERSDAFALLKERATLLIKRRLVEENFRQLEGARAADTDGESEREPSAEDSYEQRLGVALLNALAESTRDREVPLVIQSIPFEKQDPLRLEDALPPGLDAGRGVYVLRARDFLEPHLGRELLYWTQSHYHWTPFSHRLSGEALASLIEDHDLLR